MSRSVGLALACAVLCLLSPTAGPTQPLIDGSLFGFHRRPPQPQPSLTFVYRGWRIDASKAKRAQAPAKTVRAIETQVDTVERMGLKPDILAFMQTVPIIADPTPGPDTSTYMPGRGVGLRVRRLDAKRPALLYGLLQAYHDQRLSGQAADRDLDGFRRQILARRIWPKAALMLQNNQQFFALTATAYLFGAITREPYTRADLRKTEPQYDLWLARLFDGGKPRL